MSAQDKEKQTQAARKAKRLITVANCGFQCTKVPSELLHKEKVFSLHRMLHRLDKRKTDVTAADAIVQNGQHLCIFPISDKKKHSTTALNDS